MSTNGHPENRCMSFSLFFERIAWGALAAVILYAAGQLKDVTSSVQLLNTNVALLLEKAKNNEERDETTKQEIREHEQRLRALEMRRR